MNIKMNSLMLERTIEFLIAFDNSLGNKNNTPIMNLGFEVLYIVLYFLLLPIWLTNLIMPVRKSKEVN